MSTSRSVWSGSCSTSVALGAGRLRLAPLAALSARAPVHLQHRRLGRRALGVEHVEDLAVDIAARGRRRVGNGAPLHRVQKSFPGFVGRGGGAPAGIVEIVVLGQASARVRGLQVHVRRQRIGADQIALRIGGQNDGPDVFAEVVAIGEVRAAARREDLVAEPRQMDLIPLGPANGRGHVRVGAFNRPDGAAQEIPVALRARPFRDVLREHRGQSHLQGSLYGACGPSRRTRAVRT